MIERKESDNLSKEYRVGKNSIVIVDKYGNNLYNGEGYLRGWKNLIPEDKRGQDYYGIFTFADSVNGAFVINHIRATKFKKYYNENLEIMVLSRSAKSELLKFLLQSKEQGER